MLRLPGGKHGLGPPCGITTSSRRRTWVSRAVLLAILCVQAALTLRMSNTAFEDEALYLYSGHLEIAHLLHGAPLQGNYASYFSGAPVLYPVLGALADDVGGLAAARAVSLIAMLGTTALLYSLTRRLFNERVGLCAAVIFSVTESALFLGHLATYDAPALFLLALATWIVVRTAAFRWPVYLLAAPPIALAVATKYASALFVPTIVVLAALAAWPYRGRKALIPPVALGAAVAGLLAVALHLAGADYLTGIRFTTTARFQGTTPTMVLLRDSLLWGGLPFALALIGAVALRHPAADRAGRADRGGRGPGLADHAGRRADRDRAAGPRGPDPHPHPDVAAEAHRLRAVLRRPLCRDRAGPDHRRPLPPRPGRHRDLGSGAGDRDDPGQQPVQRVAGLRRVPQGHVAATWPPARTTWSRWTRSPSTTCAATVTRSRTSSPPRTSFGYTDKQRQYLTGNAAYVAAIKAGYFRVDRLQRPGHPGPGQCPRQHPAGRS